MAPLTTPTASGAGRVLVADDSGFMRRIIGQSLKQQGFDVVGEAANGDEALKLWQTVKPDCMTLDLAMPGKDGMAVLRELKGSGASVPVVVVSAFSPSHGARAVDALAEGAFDLVEKPAIGEGLEPFTSALGEKVRAAAKAGVRGLRRTSFTTTARPAVATPTPASPAAPRITPRRTGSGRVVLIASSTGGPRALAELIPALPSPLGAGGVIVQHMPEGFTKSLAERLDRQSQLTVKEAGGGELLQPDTILLAPGGRHLRIAGDRRVKLSDEPPVGALRPRADLTIEDAAKLFGERLLLVVITGMGKDGMEGAKAVRARGGRVLAEAEETCTVYGMPRAVVEAKLVHDVLPLHELPEAIAKEAWA